MYIYGATYNGLNDEKIKSLKWYLNEPTHTGARTRHERPQLSRILIEPPPKVNWISCANLALITFYFEHKFYMISY